MEFTNDYISKKKNYYNYKSVMNLDDIENVNEVYYKKIYLCPYTVNNDGLYPFINYLLYKENNTIINYLTNNSDNEKINFLEIDNSIFLMDTEQLLAFSKLSLINLCNESFSEKCGNFQDMIKCNGIKHFENDIYMFFDLTDCNIKMYDVYKKNKLWMCLIDEILNVQQVCNINIDKKVTDFFIKNIEFAFLHDLQDNKYITPSVAYVSKNNNLNFTYVFGVSKSKNDAILGPYYYFTDFYNSIDEVQLYENNDETLGIVRFAIFTDNLLVKQNFITDSTDKSKIKQEKLNDAKIDKQYEMMTMRISDYDGTWSDNYDSVYLAKLELDNGQYLKNTPIVVLKNYEQQISLSYHFINKKSLKNRMISEYSIL